MQRVAAKRSHQLARTATATRHTPAIPNRLQLVPSWPAPAAAWTLRGCQADARTGRRSSMRLLPARLAERDRETGSPRAAVAAKPSVGATHRSPGVAGNRL